MGVSHPANALTALSSPDHGRCGQSSGTRIPLAAGTGVSRRRDDDTAGGPRARPRVVERNRPRIPPSRVKRALVTGHALVLLALTWISLSRPSDICQVGERKHLAVPGTSASQVSAVGRRRHWPGSTPVPGTGDLFACPPERPIGAGKAGSPNLFNLDYFIIRGTNMIISS